MINVLSKNYRQFELCASFRMCNLMKSKLFLCYTWIIDNNRTFNSMTSVHVLLKFIMYLTSFIVKCIASVNLGIQTAPCQLRYTAHKTTLLTEQLCPFICLNEIDCKCNRHTVHAVPDSMNRETTKQLYRTSFQSRWRLAGLIKNLMNLFTTGSIDV